MTDGLTGGAEVGADGLAVGRARRAAPIAGLATRTAAEAIVAAFRKKTRSTEVSDAIGLRRAQRDAEAYARILGQSKGVLMKAGQMMSFVSLESGVPAEQRGVWQAALARLQTDAPPMEWELARATLEREIGQAVGDAFAEFDRTPIAAASIGQVHRATLQDGRRVAVKIQYPGVDAAIRADLQNGELLATLFSILRTIIPGLSRMDLRGAAAEIGRRITDELDYSAEAKNQQRFADAYRGHPVIRVPDVIPEFTTGRVLVQDLVVGKSWAQALSSDQDLKDQWGEVIFRFSVGTLRRLRAFNADPHPGNYLFHDDGGVTFLDFGCVVEFSALQVQSMVELIRSVRAGDGEGARSAAVKLGTFGGGEAPSAEEVLAWWSDTMALVLGPQPFTVTPETVAQAVRREFLPTGPSGRVVRKLDPPPELLLLGRIDSGVMSVLGELHATGNWRAIQAEIDDGGAPAGRFGAAESEFWRNR